MCDSTLFIAIYLVQNANVEHQVVEQQKDDAPLDEGPVEPLETLLDERHLVIEVAKGEKVTGSRKEQRHVELV